MKKDEWSFIHVIFHIRFVNDQSNRYDAIGTDHLMPRKKIAMKILNSKWRDL